MGLIKILLIIIILLAAIWYFSPETFSKITVFAGRAVKVDNENSQKVQGIINNNLPSSSNNNNSSTNTTNNTIISYPCNLPKGGLPNYHGTNKEGDLCYQTSGNPDYECLANPPINYSGYINTVTKFSDPEIICCLQDGYCRWEG